VTESAIAACSAVAAIGKLVLLVLLRRIKIRTRYTNDGYRDASLSRHSSINRRYMLRAARAVFAMPMGSGDRGHTARREAQMTAAKTPSLTSTALTTTALTRTAAPATLGRSADGDIGSAAQRERRKRILDATLALASKGGYDAVQMREVAERADVALGTLYRYFPSKIHLLVSGLIREFEQTKEKLDRRPIPGATPAERIIYVLNKVTKTMQREPLLTEAITRAFMFADPSAATEVNAVAALMEQMLTDAMHDGEPTADERAIARVIGDVWLSNLVAWVTRRASANDVSRQLELAARLLLR
jgi:AcrR family transcriptional regulator